MRSADERLTSAARSRPRPHHSSPSSLVRDPTLFVYNFGPPASVVPFLCTVNVTMAAPGHRQTGSVSQNHKAQLASAYNELGKELSSQKIRVVGNYTLGKVIGEGA